MQAEEGRVFQTVEPPSRRAQRASLLALVGFVGLCLLVSLANGAVLAGASAAWFRSLRAPALMPPATVLGPVWTALYVTVGVAAWLVWRRIDVGLHRKRAALRVWGWQLLVNAAWPTAFFGLHALGVSLALVLLLLASIVLTMRAFWPIQRTAALMLVPYLGWVGFVAGLTAAFWKLNGA